MNNVCLSVFAISLLHQKQEVDKVISVHEFVSHYLWLQVKHVFDQG
jgi:hypothetical protein